MPVQGEKSTMMARLKNMLIRQEGRENKRYKCTKGRWTIGIGWNIDAHGLPQHITSFEKEHGQITDAMIDELYGISVAAAISDCTKLYPRFSEFSETRKIALISFLFAGIGTAAKFTEMRKAINGGDWTRAAEELKNSLYWRQLGGDPPGTDDGRLERPEELYKMLKEG